MKDATGCCRWRSLRNLYLMEVTSTTYQIYGNAWYYKLCYACRLTLEATNKHMIRIITTSVHGFSARGRQRSRSQSQWYVVREASCCCGARPWSCPQLRCRDLSAVASNRTTWLCIPAKTVIKPAGHSATAVLATSPLALRSTCDSPQTGSAWRTTPIYMWREQAKIEWSRRVISIVACCHSVKLCAHAAQAFRSQQNPHRPTDIPGSSCSPASNASAIDSRASACAGNARSSCPATRPDAEVDHPHHLWTVPAQHVN